MAISVHVLFFSSQIIDVYEPPDHLILHHNSVSENIAGALVGIVTLKDSFTTNHAVIISLVSDHTDVFQVSNSCSTGILKKMTL